MTCKIFCSTKTTLEYLIYPNLYYYYFFLQIKLCKIKLSLKYLKILNTLDKNIVITVILLISNFRDMNIMVQLLRESKGIINKL
jgi:hypothetical protein